MGRIGRRWLIAAALVVLVAIVALLSRPMVQQALADRAAGEVTSRASAGLMAPVRAGGAAIGLHPLRLILLDLSLDRDGAYGLKSGATLERLEIRGHLPAFLRWGKHPVTIDADRPRLQILLSIGSPGPRLELPGPPPAPVAPGGERPAAVPLPPGSAVRVRNGDLQIETPDGIRFRCDRFGLDALAPLGDFGLAGRAQCGSGSLQTPSWDWGDLEGQVGFDATPTGARLDPVILHGGGFDLSGRGDLTDLATSPRLQGQGVIALETAGLSRFLPAGADPSGRIEAHVDAAWSGGLPRATGTIVAPTLRLFGVQVDAVQGDLRIDDAIHLDNFKAELLGGGLTGTVALAPAPAGGFEARATIEAERLEAQRLLALADWSGPPIEGNVRYHGAHRIGPAGNDSLSGSGDLEIDGRFAPRAGVTQSLQVQVRLTAHGRAVLMDQGTVRTGSVVGRFSGRFSPETGLNLHLSGATGNISDLLPLFRMASGGGTARGAAPLPVRLIAWGPPQPIGRGTAAAPAESPLETMVRALGGQWDWDGDLRYDRKGLRFEGRLSGVGLSWHATPIGTIDASVLYAGDRLTIRSATWRPADPGTATLHGTIDFRGAGRMDLAAVLEAFPAGLAPSLLGHGPAVDGAVSGPITVAGTFAAPEGHAAIETGPLVVEGIRFDSLRGTVDLRDDIMRAGGLVLTQGEGSLRVDGSLPVHPRSDAPGADEGGLALRGGDIDLIPFSPWLGGAEITGRIESLEGLVSGTLLRPEGRLAVKARDVTVGTFAAGEVTLEGTLAGDTMTISGAAPARGLSVHGGAGIGAGHPVDLTIDVTQLTLRGAELMAGVPDDVSLSLTGRATVSGPAAEPRALQASARFELVEVAVADTSAISDGGVEAELRDGRLTLHPALLTGAGTRIDVAGGVDLNPQGDIDLDAHGAFDLALLRSFVHGLQAEGRGDLELVVSGLRRDPAFRGTLEMKAPRVRYPDLPFPIDSLQGRIAFDGSGARIESLHFMAGGGDVDGSGEVLLGKSGPSAGLASIMAADVRLLGHGVSADFPSGFRSLSDIDFRLIFDPTGAELRGTVNLVRGVYSRDFRIESSLLTGRTPTLFEMHPTEGPIGAVRLDLALRGADQIWLRNDFGRIEGQVDIQVGGTAGRPSAAGRITALEGSTIEFNHVRYQVQSGTIDFNDPDAINPVFNLIAETIVAEYQITLQVEGTIDKFHYELTSNPALSQSDIVAVLLTGRPLTTFGTGATALSSENVSAYLAGTLGSELSSRYLGRMAPDIIAIDPLETAAQGDPTTRITVGKQITPDLRVTYTDLLGANQGAAYQLDYAIGRSLGFTSERDSNGSIGGDFRYTLTGRPPPLPMREFHLPAVDAVRIGSVHIEGEPRFPEATLLRRLHLRPGARRDRGRINDGVDRLLAFYRHNDYLAAEVDVRSKPTGEGTADLTVRAQAGPRIGVEIQGARGARRLRHALEPLWQQGIFVEDTVETARTRIESVQRDLGWRAATVTSRVLRNDPEALQVRFEVQSGELVHADGIEIVGARQISEGEVRRVIASHTDSLFHRGIVRADRLREDAARIQTLYVSRGFSKVDVHVPDVIVGADPGRATVQFRLEEGPRVSIRNTLFPGATAFPETRLSEVVDLPEGVPFTRASVEAATARLRRIYDDAGYIDVKVQARFDPVASDAEAEEGDLVFSLSEGRSQTISELTISGNVITNEKALRRALTVEPYDPLSRADLLASQTRLYKLGVVRSVDLRPVPLPPAAGAVPGVAPATAPAPVPASAPAAEPAAPAITPDNPSEPDEPLPRAVHATVLEAAPLRQVYGLGYDSEERLRGLYEIAHRNLFGTGRYLGLQMRASSIEQRASILYREQNVFGGRYDLSGSAFGIDEQRPAFNERSVGFAAQLGRDITEATRLRYRYTLRDVNLSDASAEFDGTTLRLGSLSASASHDTRDVPFDPLRGHYVAADLQGYANAFGSEADFTKFYMQVYTFRQLITGLIWAQAVRAGLAEPFGRSQSDPTSTGDVVSGVPQSERFFTGGDTTLRGIGRDLAGPLDAEGTPIGGEGLFLLNEEIRFPIWLRLHGVVFADVGNVYRTLSDYTLRDLRECVGAGLRLMTPIGPFRMEYGVLLDRRPGEAPGQFIISIGQAF